MNASQRALRDKLRRLNEDAKCLTEAEHEVIHKLTMFFVKHGDLDPVRMRQMENLLREKVIE